MISVCGGSECHDTQHSIYLALDSQIIYNRVQIFDQQPVLADATNRLLRILGALIPADRRITALDIFRTSRMCPLTLHACDPSSDMLCAVVGFQCGPQFVLGGPLLWLEGEPSTSQLGSLGYDVDIYASSARSFARFGPSQVCHGSYCCIVGGAVRLFKTTLMHLQGVIHNQRAVSMTPTAPACIIVKASD